MTALTPFPLVPLNDLSFQIVLKEIDPATGKYVPVTTGAVSAFLATSNSSTAIAADPSLVASAVHLGNGKWLVTFDGATLTPALLGPLFAAGTPYCILQRTGGFRRYVQGAYSDAEAATA